MLIEYTNVQERREKLKELKGVERKIWIKLGASAPVFPIADEDLEREDDTKTSAVHFLRWEFSESSIKGLKENPNISMGVDHDKYSCNPRLILDKPNVIFRVTKVSPLLGDS